MSSITQTVLRLLVFVDSRQAFLDYATGQTPAAWNGTDINCQVTFVKGDPAEPTLITAAELADVSVVTLDVLPLSRTGVAYMSKSASMADFNTNFTFADFLTNAANAFHLSVAFSFAENNLPIPSGLNADYWMVIHGNSVSNPTRKPVFGGTTYSVIADGVPAATGPLQGGNIVPANAVYDNAGHYVLNVTQDAVYDWVLAANDTSVTNGTETVAVTNTSFTAQGPTVRLNGTANQVVTAVVRQDSFLTQQQSDGRYLQISGNNGMVGMLNPKHITFNPLPNPGAPTVAPVTKSGGNQGAFDLFAYQIAWIDASGNPTLPSGNVANAAPVAPNNATRLTFPAPPVGAVSVAVYRSADGTLNRFLLATVAASATHYDDGESADDFAARYNPALIPTPYNLTAGKIFSKPGQLCFFFSADGLKVLLPIQFDGPLTVNGETVFNGPLTLQGPLIITDGNMRIKDGQVQYWDAAAFAADNTKPWRAHGVNNGQTDWGNPVAD